MRFVGLGYKAWGTSACQRDSLRSVALVSLPPSDGAASLACRPLQLGLSWGWVSLNAAECLESSLCVWLCRHRYYPGSVEKGHYGCCDIINCCCGGLMDP